MWFGVDGGRGTKETLQPRCLKPRPLKVHGLKSGTGAIYFKQTIDEFIQFLLAVTAPIRERLHCQYLSRISLP